MEEKFMLRIAAAALFGVTMFATPASADTYVNGYFKNDGTYVQPHYRTNPDSNSYNNYSAQGNTNPYTGRQGTADPLGAYSNGYNNNLGISSGRRRY
jgi:hypothetical protein